MADEDPGKEAPTADEEAEPPTNVHSGPQVNWVVIVVIAAVAILILILIVALFHYLFGSSGQNVPTSNGPPASVTQP